MKYSSSEIILAFATGFTVIGQFPDTPKVLQDFFNKNKFLKWITVFIVIWQGGGKQDHKLAVLITATMFALYKALE